MYASTTIASHIRWHAKHLSEVAKMRHPSNNETWLIFNTNHSDFARETRNVRLELCTDGLNPFDSSMLARNINSI